ncbi:hypothetical protein KSU1_C0478 [Candidatus Jettenia caeni]|uniref:Uncharacterized protein n=1 Tax=Candidatus Jettenia caeni TaxID=247490 RepID=I3IK29_9BACT|nr:hypothetical protein KSU1_C0478 [Candidatus Jettenia caeni]
MIALQHYKSNHIGREISKIPKIFQILWLPYSKTFVLFNKLYQ